MKCNIHITNSPNIYIYETQNGPHTKHVGNQNSQRAKSMNKVVYVAYHHMNLFVCESGEAPPVFVVVRPTNRI